MIVRRQFCSAAAPEPFEGSARPTDLPHSPYALPPQPTAKPTAPPEQLYRCPGCDAAFACVSPPAPPPPPVPPPAPGHLELLAHTQMAHPVHIPKAADGAKAPAPGAPIRVIIDNNQFSLNKNNKS